MEAYSGRYGYLEACVDKLDGIRFFKASSKSHVKKRGTLSDDRQLMDPSFRSLMPDIRALTFPESNTMW
jgi:hypothetical protein